MDEETKRIKREIFGKPKEVVQGQPDIVNDIEVAFEVSPELLKRFPPERLKKIMAKEARRYQSALRKKWRNWLESMSR